MQGSFRVALIGYGFMGRAHSNAYHQVGHFFDLERRPALKVICGRDRDKLSSMAAQWGWESQCADWREAVARQDVDAVDIVAPNFLHAEIAMAAAAAGKMVLCEKPMAVSLEEAEAMTAAARGVPSLVWFNYRRVPAIAYAKQLIDEGRVGRVFHYRAAYLQQWGADPARRSGWKMAKKTAGSGVTGDLLSHVVDTAMWLNGPISEVCAMQTTFEPGRDIDDAAAVLIRFGNGSTGTFEATRYGTGGWNRQGFEMNGEKGALAFNLEELNRLAFFDATLPKAEQGTRSLMVTGPEHPHASSFWAKPGHILGYEHTFVSTLADFLAAQEKGGNFHPDFADGLRVHQVLDAIERSAAARCWIAIA